MRCEPGVAVQPAGRLVACEHLEAQLLRSRRSRVLLRVNKEPASDTLPAILANGRVRVVMGSIHRSPPQLGPTEPSWADGTTSVPPAAAARQEEPRFTAADSHELRAQVVDVRQPGREL